MGVLTGYSEDRLNSALNHIISAVEKSQEDGDLDDILLLITKAETLLFYVKDNIVFEQDQKNRR